MGVHTSFETSNNQNFYGFLLLLTEFQSSGYDLHLTLCKDKTAHISLYEGTKKKWQKPVNITPTGFSISFAIQQLIKSETSIELSKADYQDYADQAHKKAVEIGYLASKPPVKANNSFNVMDMGAFPALGKSK